MDVTLDRADLRSCGYAESQVPDDSPQRLALEHHLFRYQELTVASMSDQI